MSVQGLGIRACMRPPTDGGDDVVRTMSSNTTRTAPSHPRFRYSKGRASLSARPAAPAPDPDAAAEGGEAAGGGGAARARSASTAAAAAAAGSGAGARPRDEGVLRGGGVVERRARRRALYPAPPFRPPDGRASMPAFLGPSALPADCRPESVDVTFKAHLALLRRLTCDPFEAHNRYLFIHKPLARANAALAAALFNVPESDTHSAVGMSAELRAAVMYVACNSFRSVYGMAFAGQMKSLYKAGPPPDGQLAGMLINGLGLSPVELAALDFTQELAALPPAAVEITCRAVSARDPASDDVAHRLERQVAGVVAYAAFMCRAFGALDVELSYEAVKFAAANLSHGLQWNSAGRHFNFGAMEDITDDAISPGREASTSRNRTVSRRLPNLISSSVTVPRLLTESSRATDAWLRQAWIPKAGKMLEMNDCIKSSFGFYPFYLSVSTVLGEGQRRALLFGAKELLFLDGEVSRRLKFIICYVTSLYLVKPSERPGATGTTGTFNEDDASNRPLQRTTFTVDRPVVGVPREWMKRRGSLSTIMETGEEFAKELGAAVGDTADKPLNAESSARISRDPSSVANNDSISTNPSMATMPMDYKPEKTKTPAPRTNGYDAVGIITAHAAFLACRYGATAAELLAAGDEKKVMDAMERYLAQSDDDTDMVAYPLGFPLTKKDCAAVLLAHALAKSPPDVSADQLQYIESAFGRSPFAQRTRGGRTCHRAVLEIVGAASMWGLLERYCAGAVTFDVDYSANLYFAGGAAEPAIMDFAKGPIGVELGLALSRRFRDERGGMMGKAGVGFVGGAPGVPPAWILDRASTYRMSSGGGPVPLKERFRSRSRKRSVSFLSSTGDRVSRVFNGFHTSPKVGSTSGKR